MASLVFNPDVLKGDAPDKSQRQARKLIDEKQFDCIEWCVHQNGQTLSQGREAIDSVAQPTESSIYRIYSMTKPVVSFVAMQLIDEGKLSLDDALSLFIPAMANLKVLDESGEKLNLKSPITVAHLLTHTAGFSYDFLPNCAVAEKYRDVSLTLDASRSLSEVIGMLTTMPLAYQPGEQWHYSVAIDVLAHVLENVTGKSLPELLHLHVFEPLGMQDTAFHVEKDQQHRVMPIFGSRDLGQVMIETEEPNSLNALDVAASYPIEKDSEFYRGGHGLYSTIDDYLKFMHVMETGRSMDNKQLISTKAFDLMWNYTVSPKLQPLVLGFTEMGGYSWNLAGRVMENPEQCVFNTALGEGGWSGAASTHFWIDRANGISGITMAQYVGSTPALGPLMQHAAYGMFKPAT